MAATGLQANWTGVAHGTTTINRVDSIGINSSVTLTGYQGDSDVWDSCVIVTNNSVTVTVNSSNVATLMGIAPGTAATLTAVHKDAKNAASGAINYTIINAVAGTVQANGAHGQYGSGSITFQCYSADGATNPISFTRS